MPARDTTGEGGGEPLQNSYPAGSPLGLAPLQGGIVIRPSSRNNARAESRKGIRPRGNDTVTTAIFTARQPC